MLNPTESVIRDPCLWTTIQELSQLRPAYIETKPSSASGKPRLSRSLHASLKQRMRKFDNSLFNLTRLGLNEGGRKVKVVINVMYLPRGLSVTILWSAKITWAGETTIFVSSSSSREAASTYLSFNSTAPETGPQNEPDSSDLLKSVQSPVFVKR